MRTKLDCKDGAVLVKRLYIVRTAVSCKAGAVCMYC